MKSLLKPLLLSTSLSALAFCSTFSLAADATQKQMNHNKSFSSLIYALPHLESEGVTKLQLTTINSIQGADNSLLPISKPDAALTRSCKAKKSSLYELTAIFNDKLQMFLSQFNDSTEYALAKQDKKKDNLPAINTHL